MQSDRTSDVASSSALVPDTDHRTSSAPMFSSDRHGHGLSSRVPRNRDTASRTGQSHICCRCCEARNIAHDGSIGLVEEYRRIGRHDGGCRSGSARHRSTYNSSGQSRRTLEL